MKNADKFVVGGQVYNVLSPATFGDYMETIGSACINPDGYAENKLFLAYDDNVQKLFRATAAIAYSELLIKDTNCEPTTMAEALANALSAGGVSYDNTDSGLTASNVQGAIDEVNENVETVNSDLSNKTDEINTIISANGAKNLIQTRFKDTVWRGIAYTVNPVGYPKGCVKINGTATDASYVFADGNYYKKGRYRISGTPSGGNYNTGYAIYVVNRITGSTVATDAANTLGLTDEFVVTDESLEYGIGIIVRAHVTVNDLICKPMIELISETDVSGYEPPAKSNQMITEELGPYSYYAVDNPVTSSNGTVSLVGTKYGKVFSMIVYIYNSASWASGSGSRITFDLPSNFPKPAEAAAVGGGLNSITMQISVTGAVMLQNNNGSAIAIGSGQSASITYVCA